MTMIPNWQDNKIKCCINGSQLAKMKKSIPDMPCHKIYRDEAVGLKS